MRSADRYRVDFYGDDIAWLRADPDDGKIYAINPEFGVFGVAKDTSEVTNPAALAAVAPGTGTVFTNVAYNDHTHEVWWEGRTPVPPADLTGWRDWTGMLISERPAEEKRRAVGASEQPVHHRTCQRAERRAGLRQPERRADRRDHLRRPRA
jgi:GTP-dependent phosphoenolpyruvate carboxykinase